MSMSTFGMCFYSLYCWIAHVTCWLGPLVVLTVRSSCFVSISASKLIQ